MEAVKSQPTATEEKYLETPGMPAEENKSNTSQPSYAKEKMIFLVLLESAMRYREMYYREEIAAFTAVQKEALAAHIKKTKTSFSQQKKWETKLSANIATFTNLYEQFNKMVDNEIKGNVDEKQMTTGTPFDNYVAAFGLLANEFVRCKNTTELLTLAKSYNDGAFDEAMEHLKKTELKDDGTEPAIPQLFQVGAPIEFNVYENIVNGTFIENTNHSITIKVTSDSKGISEPGTEESINKSFLTTKTNA